MLTAKDKDLLTHLSPHVWGLVIRQNLAIKTNWRTTDNIYLSCGNETLGETRW